MFTEKQHEHRPCVSRMLVQIATPCSMPDTPLLAQPLNSYRGFGAGGSFGSSLQLMLQRLLAAQRVQSAVCCLLAAHEHGTEGWTHAGAAIQLSHLPSTDKPNASIPQPQRLSETT